MKSHGTECPKCHKRDITKGLQRIRRQDSGKNKIFKLLMKKS